MSRVLHAVPDGSATASDDSQPLAQLPARGRTTGSFVDASRAPGTVEAQLVAALRAQSRLRAENARLVRSLAAVARGAATARRIARRDGLTGLPNRLFLIERLQSAMAAAGRQRSRLALLFIDLDGFKTVNDTFGHLVADRLLAAVASRIAACVRVDDIACRYGGDEFVAMLTSLGDASVAIGVSQKIRDRVADTYTISGHEIRITASIGIAVYPDEGTRWGALLSHADAAMYRDKASRLGR
jgi:diguanylate cyclase (GGDEF)-like protein